MKKSIALAVILVIATAGYWYYAEFGGEDGDFSFGGATFFQGLQFSNASSSVQNLSGNAQVILSNNSDRRYAAVVNQCDKPVYLFFATTTAHTYSPVDDLEKGWRLNASSTADHAFEINHLNRFTGAVTASSSQGISCNVFVLENN